MKKRSTIFLMKNNLVLVISLLLGLSQSTGFCGGTAQDLKKPILHESMPTPELEKSPWKFGDPIRFFDGKLALDVQERLRFEYRNNNFDFNDSRNHKSDDAFLLQRLRLGALVTACEWVKVYVQGQDSREIDSDRQGEPFIFGSEGNDTFDLYQGYLDIGNASAFPITARLGRQVLSYGDERLIGGFDWNNFGRTFDAMKFQYTHLQTRTTVDCFMGNVVTVEGSDHPENHTWEFNESDSHDLLSGLYVSSKGLSFQKTEGYLLYRNKDRMNPEYRTAGGAVNTPYDVKQEVWTLGGRLQSTSLEELYGFDYEVEGAYQFGSVGARQGVTTTNPTSASSQDLSAFATHLAAGYNWQSVAYTPRFGLVYDYASGDEDPTDSKSGTFMNLFPTNHKFYGNMDAFSWKNIHDLAWTASIKPTSKVTLKVAHHFFWLAETSDAMYRANGVTQVRAVNASATSADSFVGQELDVTAYYTCTQWLSFMVGYSHFFAGPYLKQTENTAAAFTTQSGAPAPGGDDADLIYVQSVLKF